MQWGANTEDRLLGYRIYYDIDAGAPYEGTDADQGTSPIEMPLAYFADPNNPRVTLTGLSDASDYFFAVTAYSADEESGYSNEASIEGDQPVVAEAGPNQTVDEGVTVTLDGSNSNDPDDTIAAYAWTQTGGPAVALSDASAAQPTFTSPDVDEGGASLTFLLTVTNDQGHSATDSVTINVTWQNIPPQADAGADQTVNEGTAVTLDGSHSYDPDDGSVDFAWTQTKGPGVTLSNATSAQAGFTAPDVDSNGVSLTFQLTVTDSNGLQDTDTVTVNVTWDNIPPHADAGADQTVNEGATVTLDGSHSYDPDDGLVDFTWTQTEGPGVTLSDPAASNPTFVTVPVDVNGAYLTFQVTVTDADGLRASDDVIVTINNNGISGFPDEVLTLTTATGDPIGLTLTGGSLVKLYPLAATEVPTGENGPDLLLYGLLDITIKADAVGGTAILTVYLPSPAPEWYTWFNYDENEGWRDCSEQITFNSERDQVAISLVDGGASDNDGIANGIIEDPAGLGSREVESSNDAATDTSIAESGISSEGGGGGCFISSVFPFGSGK